MSDIEQGEWITLQNPRPLSDWERSIFSKLLSHDFVGSRIVREQLDHIRVAEELRGDPTIQLSVHAESPVLRRDDGSLVWGALPVSLETRRDDPLGWIHALVHVRDGRVAELEFVRIGSNGIDELPSPDDFVCVPD